MTEQAQAYRVDPAASGGDSSESTPRFGPKATMHAVMSRALDEAHDNWDAACDLFERWIEEDQDLFTTLARPALMASSRNVAREIHRHKRSRLRSEARSVTDNKPTVEHFRSRLSGREQIAEEREETLFDHPITGGLALGDATIVEIRQMIDGHSTLARSNAIEARFYTLIAKKLSANKKVRDVYTPEELEKLQRQANRD